MQYINKKNILIALAISIFTGCGNNSNNTHTQDEIFLEDNATNKSYIINSLENKDIPITANILVQSQDTKVKITRDIESDMMNLYVISGSVAVQESSKE